MRPTLGAALLLIVTALVYAPTVTYGWVYEDLNDPERFFAEPRAPIAWVQEAIAHPWRQVTQASFDVSRLIGSPVEPWGFHLVSVLLHLLNSLLLYRLALRVLEPWAAVGALAIFALHPLQVEAVAYISSRADVLMTTAILCALLAMESRRWVLAGLACVFAIGAKELGVVAFPLMFVWAVWRRIQLPREVIGGMMAGAFVALFYILRTGLLPALDLQFAGGELFKAYTLLLKVVIPVGFSIDHAWVITPGSAAFGLALTAFLVGCACLVSRSLFALSLAWVLVCLSPRIVTPLVEGLHEHHLYAPLIAIALMVGHLLTLGKGSHGISATPAQA